ncbi:MAG TPA: DUF72 domain-containing protein [Polyangiaceae bacterium]|nr:DUF72 domain-containing protein [Polyangiaceae bacterium]
MAATQAQGTLFELPPEVLEAAPARPEHVELAARLPAGVRLGTMSWTFPGWRGSVYAKSARGERLATEGLAAYAKHPLLRAVEIDRSYYDPLSSESFRRLAGQVPEGFQFLVKAHQACTLQRFPQHARYGKKRGEANGLFLDAAYATEAVIGPALAGLGAKLSALLFQFSPEELGSPQGFAERLRSFLAALPRGVTYAVELRNPPLFTPAYAAALVDGGAVHCHNAWGELPSVLAQAKGLPPVARRPLIVRWLFPPGDSYAAASERLAPFDRIVLEDPTRRQAIARLVVTALRHDVPALVLVNNDAEGCAPESIDRLARAIVERSGPRL